MTKSPRTLNRLLILLLLFGAIKSTIAQNIEENFSSNSPKQEVRNLEHLLGFEARKLIPSTLKIEISNSKGFGLYTGVGYKIGDGIRIFNNYGEGEFLWTIGGSFNRNLDRTMFGYKFTTEYHRESIFSCVKLQLWHLFYDNNDAIKLSPEIGLSFIGLIYTSVGYDFSLTRDNFSNINGFRMSLGFNFIL